MWPWINHLIFQRVCVLVYKMGVMIQLTHWAISKLDETTYVECQAHKRLSDTDFPSLPSPPFLPFESLREQNWASSALRFPKGGNLCLPRWNIGDISAIWKNILWGQASPLSMVTADSSCLGFLFKWAHTLITEKFLLVAVNTQITWPSVTCSRKEASTPRFNCEVSWETEREGPSVSELSPLWI